MSTDDQIITCPDCGKECKNRQGLNKHHHHCPVLTQATVCSFCNKQFSTIGNLTRHITTCKINKEQEKVKEDIAQSLAKRIQELETQCKENEIKYKEHETKLKEQFKENAIKLEEQFKQQYSTTTKLLEHDIKILHDKEKEYKTCIGKQEAIIEEQRKKINDHEVDSKYEQKRLIDVISTMCKQTHSNTILQTNNNIQQTTNFIIQPFEQSAFKGYIKPPDVWESTVDSKYIKIANLRV